MPIPAGTKFHGVAPSVDTTDRGSATLQTLRDAYAIEEFGGGTLSTTVDITPAQIVALHTTPVEIVPAQGVGKAIVVISAQVKLLFNSVPYTSLSNTSIGLIMSPVPGFDEFQYFFKTDDLTASSDVWLSLNRWGNIFTSSSLVDNGSLVLKLDETTAALSGGDSPVQITVEYKIVT